MKKIKLADAEIDLIKFILNKQVEYGWDSCLGGHDLDDKKEVKEYNKNMDMIQDILLKLNIQ